MKKILMESSGDVAVVRLANGVTNAIGHELLEDLSSALADVKSGFRGMVLAGGEKFFSIGLNLPEVLGLDQKGMTDFWTLFEDTVLDLYTLPVPTAAAINGHATAGGAILALACDFRFTAAGRKLIGLNEIGIGVPVPYLADRMLRQTVGDRVATEMEYGGKLVPPEEARAVGLVDGVCKPEEVETAAIEKVTRLAAAPARAFELTKRHRVREIPARFQAVRPELDRTFMECWFDSKTQGLLREAAKKF